MTTWSIGHSENERFTVELLSPSAKDEGYDWITARAIIAVGGFHGDTQLMITLSDLIRFAEQLQRLNNKLKGEAEFTTIEDQVRIKLTTDGLGHITATGYLIDQAGTGNELRFTLDLDQTFLQETINQIEQAIKQSKK